MADTLELQVAKGIEDALNVVSVTVAAGTVQRPQGLTVHRDRLRPLQTESLPAQIVHGLGERELADADEAVGQLYRVARIGIESRVELPEGVPLDDALDELRAWCDIAVMADETLGGIAHFIEIEGSPPADFQEGAKTIGILARTYRVQYQRLRNDPRNAT